MANAVVFLVSLVTVLFSTLSYVYAPIDSINIAVFSIMTCGLIWAFGSVLIDSLPAGFQELVVGRGDARSRYVTLLFGAAAGAALSVVVALVHPADEKLASEKVADQPASKYQNTVDEFRGAAGDRLKTVVHNYSDRRVLAGESRRFDTIQVWDGGHDGVVTTESLRLYFDRLKTDGILQILNLSGERARAAQATLAEAWKKSGRRDVDLHAVATAVGESGEAATIVLRMSPFAREEREKLNGLLGVGQNHILVSDSSGRILTDDQPNLDDAFTLNSVVMSGAVILVLALILWVSLQERRQELTSRWQTASIASYFAGLGISFAFFLVFFAWRAVRTWGLGSAALGLVVAALCASCAIGASVFAGRPGRRAGVRIQTLANFVFAVMFTYLGATLFEPLMRSGSSWLAAFIGMSVLVPFGLAGGAFLPNAFEEASGKLAPRAMSLLWALYVAGAVLGFYTAINLGWKNGLDAVYLAGLFCFAWVAIFSGLLRPWNVRKDSTSEERA